MKKLILQPAAKVTVEFDGKDYVLSKPSMAETLLVESELEAVKEPGGKSATRVMYEFVLRSGLPQEIVELIDADGLMAIVELLTPAKKK